jgi:hypothetical protein
VDRFRKPLHYPEEFRHSPLQIAVALGFHSLVVLLGRHEASVDVENRALAEAVKLRKEELAELLLSLGACVNAVPLVDVLRSWDPHLIRLFLASGADVITESPFAHAFAEKIHTALRPFLDHLRGHPELRDGLQTQIDAALRYFSP